MQRLVKNYAKTLHRLSSNYSATLMMFTVKKCVSKRIIDLSAMRLLVI